MSGYAGDIGIVKYNIGPDGNLNVPVSVDERAEDEWFILQANGVKLGGYRTKEEAIDDWREQNPQAPVSATIVRVTVTVSHEGQLGPGYAPGR